MKLKFGEQYPAQDNTVYKKQNQYANQGFAIEILNTMENG